MAHDGPCQSSPEHSVAWHLPRWRIHMKPKQAVVWIDHDEAHILHFDADASKELTVRSKHRKSHLHHRSGQVGAGRAPMDHRFYEETGKALIDAEKILIVGPANAKSELQKH